MAATFDNKHKRATYNVPYVVDENDFIFLKNKNDYERVLTRDNGQHTKLSASKKKFVFKYTNAYVTNVAFDQCSFFHQKKNSKIQSVDKLTFQGCSFDYCFFGSVVFNSIRFQDCTFNRTDFSNTDFNYCTFHNCTFINCSAYNTNFTSSEINPSDFLRGLSFPTYNCSGLNEVEREALKKEWMENRVHIATSLFRSNTGVAHSEFSDLSLYHLKDCEVKYNRSNISWQDIFKQFRVINSCLFSEINLFATKGGVSLKRILIIAISLISIFTFLVKFWTNVSYNTTVLTFAQNASISHHIEDYLATLPYILTLFLGFGFSNFKTTTPLEDYIVIAITSIGILWYALLIPVLIRKVYR